MVEHKHAERRRFDPGRFRRIWALAQTIADEPGHSRDELAARFHISPRQIQADLVIIRDDLRLPLRRVHGYRFVGEGAPAWSGGLTLQDALTLVLTLGASEARRSEQGLARIEALAEKLPIVFPPHLQPIVGRMLGAVAASGSPSGRLFLGLAAAVLEDRWVRLHEQFGEEQTAIQEPIVKPEILFPYADRWCLIARCDPRDTVSERVLFLDAVRAVTLVAVPA